MKHYRWQRVHGTPTETYHDVWIEEDGSLHNPHGYPEELARAAVLKADAWKAEKLANARKRGVQTRRERQAARIHQAARRILDEAGIGKQTRCYCCRKVLTDPASIDRGIGSECWQHVLDIVAKMKVAEG